MNVPRQTISLSSFLVGLLTGLGVCVAAALYLTNSPVPFISKVQHSTENVTPESSDPNKPLYNSQGAANAAADAAAKPAPLPAPAPASAPGSAPVAAPDSVASIAGAVGAAGASGPAADAQAARMMLQVGAYKAADDADAMRARLALLGLDASVTAVQADGATLYRVRLGPFGRLDDLNGIRRTLSENGMEPQIVHLP